MAYASWLADALRAAGLNVKTYPGWETRSSLSKTGAAAGPLNTRSPGVVWHHDASPPGDSPGALNWMRSQLEVRSAASANIWVDRYGTWHLIAAGVTWHAGTSHNYSHLGIETDHTVGEDWPTAQLHSLRRGTAAILAHTGRGIDGLTFHKTILPGNKVDPDGLDLATERAAVAALMQGDDDDLTPEQHDRLIRVENLLSTGRADTSIGSQGWPWTFGYWTAALMAKVDQGNATIAAQNAALKALASGQGVDPEKLSEVIDKAVKDSLSDLRITAG